VVQPLHDLDALRSIQPERQAGTVSKQLQPGQPSFAEVLGKLEGSSLEPTSLRFSKHAQNRLDQRGVRLQESDLRRLEDAVNKAAEKGSKDSLVLMDDLALVVSVRNRTVITAVNAASEKESVFTNIDTVVVTK